LLHHAGIRQVVCKGTHILDRLFEHPLSGVEHLPPPMLFRHALTLVIRLGAKII
jgi:hypothetical protein